MKSTFFAILFITLSVNPAIAQSADKTGDLTPKDSIMPVDVNWKTPLILDEIYANWVSKNKNKTIEGFRIQLYNGTSKEAENFNIKFLMSKIELKG